MLLACPLQLLYAMTWVRLLIKRVVEIGSPLHVKARMVGGPEEAPCVVADRQA